MRSEADCYATVNAALANLKAEFASTPLGDMSMEIESYHPGVILLDKKRYCKLGSDGSIRFTGVSAARRNVAGLVKQTCVKVASSIILLDSAAAGTSAISRNLEVVLAHVMSGKVTVKDVSSIASHDRLKCYSYRSVDGQDRRRQLWKSHLGASDVSACEILENVRSECNRLTVPCGLGDTMKICRRAERFID